jgi:hypothetical protein
MVARRVSAVTANSALVLQAPVAINISLQLLVTHIRKLVHALALYALLVVFCFPVVLAIALSSVSGPVGFVRGRPVREIRKCVRS